MGRKFASNLNDVVCSWEVALETVESFKIGSAPLGLPMK
jgi:hypothetical protein